MVSSSCESCNRERDEFDSLSREKSKRKLLNGSLKQKLPSRVFKSNRLNDVDNRAALNYKNVIHGSVKWCFQGASPYQRIIIIDSQINFMANQFFHSLTFSTLRSACQRYFRLRKGRNRIVAEQEGEILPSMYLPILSNFSHLRLCH